MNPVIVQRRQSASDEESMSSVPSLDHRTHSIESRFGVPTPQHASRITVNTYRTTASSFEDDDDEEQYYERAKPAPRTVPATPIEFAQLFPTTSRLAIRHDDSPYDGNMNIRVDRCGVTLFHARIYDLRDRDVSVRRYGRDCGREVAHAKRKFLPQRPSLAKAFSSFRGWGVESEIAKKIQRVDSGYGSGGEEEDGEEVGSDFECSSRPSTPRPRPSNTCTLEFANYAHVELTRRGSTNSKKYDFEYWGTTYSWRRVGDQEGSYQLLNTSPSSSSSTSTTASSVVAVIRPDEMTPEMEMEEQEKAGFVPPCSLYLVDSRENPVTANRTDVADVIVSTALMTLIDDSIKRRYHRKRIVQVSLPGGAGKGLNMEYVGPRRFVNEMFSRHRRGGAGAGADDDDDGRRPSLVRSLSTSARLRTW